MRPGYRGHRRLCQPPIGPGSGAVIGWEGLPRAHSRPMACPILDPADSSVVAATATSAAARSPRRLQSEAPFCPLQDEIPPFNHGGPLSARPWRATGSPAAIPSSPPSPLASRVASCLLTGPKSWPNLLECPTRSIHLPPQSLPPSTERPASTRTQPEPSRTQPAPSDWVPAPAAAFHLARFKSPLSCSLFPSPSPCITSTPTHPSFSPFPSSSLRGASSCRRRRPRAVVAIVAIVARRNSFFGSTLPPEFQSPAPHCRDFQDDPQKNTQHTTTAHKHHTRSGSKGRHFGREGSPPSKSHF